MITNMIKVIVSGQLFQSSGIVYNTESANDDWTRCIVDIRGVGRTLTNNTSNNPHLYSIWHNEYGYYVAYAKVNPKAGRDGWCMVTLFLENKTPLNGDKIRACLQEISEYFISRDSDREEDSRNGRFKVLQDEIEQIISRNISSEDLTEAYIPYRKITQDDKIPQSEDACRVYASDLDLNNILQYPYQVEYEGYKKIYLVSKEIAIEDLVSSKSQNNYKTITIGTWSIDYISSPIKKIYTISIPDGVRVKRVNNEVPIKNGDKIQEGEELIISYTKDGFNDYLAPNQIAGKLSDFIYHDGITLKIHKNPQVKDMVFKKTFTIEVYDKETREPLSEYRLYTANNEVSRELHVSEGKKKTIQIEADGYNPETKEILCSDIADGEKIKVYLNANIKKIHVLIRDNNEDIWDNISVKANNKLYRVLKEAENKGYFVFKSKQESEFPLKAILASLITGIFAFAFGVFMAWYSIIPYINEKIEEKQRLEANDQRYLVENNEWELKLIQSSKYQKFYKYASSADKRAFENYREIQQNEEWKKLCDEYKSKKDDKKERKKFVNHIKNKRKGNKFYVLPPKEANGTTTQTYVGSAENKTPDTLTTQQTASTEQLTSRGSGSQNPSTTSSPNSDSSHRTNGNSDYEFGN